MRMRTRRSGTAVWAVAIGLGWALAGGVSLPARGDDPAVSAPTPAPGEVIPEVPALTAFHEVIFQLWHRAWPEKDAQMMKDLLPQVREGVAAVAEAELPGILRDRRGDWDDGVAALRDALNAYERAAATNNAQGLADAVEALHARFEGLVRITRPAMPELDAYHVELYRIFHYFLPGRDLDSLRTGSARLAARGAGLATLDIPPRFAAIADTLRGEFAVLADRSAALDKAARDGEWPRIESAVGSVHDQYVKVEGLVDAAAGGAPRH
jgi:hypothetical protein